MMPTYDLILLIVAMFLSFSMISYIWFGASIFFDLAESVMIGGMCAAGIFGVYGSIVTSGVNKIAAGSVWLVVPLFIGFLAFTRLTRFRWLARYPVAVMSGVGLGVMVGLTVRAQILAAASSTVQDIVGVYDPLRIGWAGATASNVLVLLGVVTVLAYFMYSARYSSQLHTGRLRIVTKIGRYFMFASFGYLYSSIFFAEGVDSVADKLIVLVRRTIDALLA